MNGINNDTKNEHIPCATKCAVSSSHCADIPNKIHNLKILTKFTEREKVNIEHILGTNNTLNKSVV